MCGLSTVVTPAGASLTMYREIRSYANSIWDDNNNNNIHTYILPCVMVYYIVSVLFLLFFWSPCVAINVSVQYNGGLLPDIILLTQCYFHRGTRLNAM